jgi:hypothetical protein
MHHIQVTAITAAVALDIFFWGALVGLTQSQQALSSGTFIAHAGNAGIALLQVGSEGGCSCCC